MFLGHFQKSTQQMQIASPGWGLAERCISKERDFLHGDGVTVYSNEDDRIRFIVRFVYTFNQWRLITPPREEYDVAWFDCFLKRATRIKEKAPCPKKGDIFHLHLSADCLVNARYREGSDLPPDTLTIQISEIHAPVTTENYFFVKATIVDGTVGTNLLTMKIPSSSYFERRSNQSATTLSDSVID